VKRFILVLLVAAGALLAFSWRDGELLSPLVLGDKRVAKDRDYKTVGFLPTWMIGKTMEYCEEIDELIFLGVEVDEEGDLVWDVQGKKLKGEIYLKQKKRIKECGGRNVLGIKQFDDEKLKKIISNKEVRENLIKQVKSEVDSGGFDGVNVDFEYQRNPFAVLEKDFVSFLKDLREAGVGEVSLDVFANTVIKGDGEALKELVGNLDSLIVMAYDFHRPSSLNAGPVAPIGSEPGKRNILEITQKVVESQLDKEKVVLAYPLYGYEWKTETDEYGAKTRKWSAMASYKRVKELLGGNEEIIANLDEVSMTPWLTYEKGKDIFQIYYEDLRSLKVKIDLAKQTQLGGVGFWALGYEGEDGELWAELL
jgi:spore germination protein